MASCRFFLLLPLRIQIFYQSANISTVTYENHALFWHVLGNVPITPPRKMQEDAAPKLKFYL